MLYLASNSPRRKDILEMIGIDFELVQNDFDESMLSHEDPTQFVLESSYKKAESAIRNVENGFILGADTIGYFEDAILGKPKDIDDTVRMLKQLRNSKHSVYTGIAIMKVENGVFVHSKNAYEKTDVYFSNFSDDLINEYISTDSPLDKAASYGIQDKGSLFVEKIDGCFYNVVGLPVNLFSNLYSHIRNMNN